MSRHVREVGDGEGRIPATSGPPVRFYLLAPSPCWQERRLRRDRGSGTDREPSAGRLGKFRGSRGHHCTVRRCVFFRLMHLLLLSSHQGERRRPLGRLTARAVLAIFMAIVACPKDVVPFWLPLGRSPSCHMMCLLSLPLCLVAGLPLRPKPEVPVAGGTDKNEGRERMRIQVALGLPMVLGNLLSESQGLFLGESWKGMRHHEVHESS